MRSLRLSWVFAIVASLAATSALAAPPTSPSRPPIDDRPLPILHPITPAPVNTTAPPLMTLPRLPRPGTGGNNNGQYVGVVPNGTKVSLSRLPRLPMKTAMNTATPKRHKMLHPMAASGATIDFSATAVQNSCISSNSIGDQFNVGCVLLWQAINLPSASDSYTDYEVAPGNGNELTSSATAISSYAGSAAPNESTTLSVSGTYIFGVYDTTTQAWVAVVYVNAGTVFSIKVYQDSFHTQEQYQFAASSGTNAFIYLQNVTASDYLAVGISQTGVAPNCVFEAPAPLTSPPPFSNQLCNLTASTGEQAPGGNLQVTWAMNPSLRAGTYSVEVFDLTTGTRLGQVQVALTGASGVALNLYPDTTNPVNQSPGPTSVATPSTIIAYDGSNWNGGTGTDESVTGVKTTVTGLTNGSNYLWSLIDPQGQVVGTNAGTIAGNSGTNIFTFNSLSGGASAGGALTQVLPPGDYPAKSWVVQLYDTTHNTVDASQAFQILGYATQTQFNQSGSLSTSLQVPTGATGITAALRLTNSSSTAWNGFGDNLTQLIFSTSQNSFNLSSGTGAGILTALNGQACGTTVCTEAVTDSAGNAWTASNDCTAASGSAFCTILVTPNSASTSLAPGAYIDITNVKFTQSTGSTCRPCQSATSELPSHGMYWSSVTNAPAVAYNPVFFNKTSTTESATAYFRFYGSWNQGTETTVEALNPTPQPTPLNFVGTHFYTNTQAQADYNNNSPYTVTASSNLFASNEDIMGLTIKDTGSDPIFEVAIGFPGTFTNQGFIGIDTVSFNNWAFTTCGTGFSSAWVCILGRSGHTISTTQPETIYIDQSMSASSFAFSDLQIQGEVNHGSSQIWVPATAAAGTTTTVDGRNTLDNLAFGNYSLIGGDMTGAFNPSTIGTGGTATLGWQFTNTSNAQDANPDSIDAIVLEAPNTTVTLGNTPSVTTAGWSYLGQLPAGGAFNNQYWFGICSSFKTTLAQSGASYGGPPSATGATNTTPFTAPYPTATCNPDTSAVGPGANVTATNMQFSNIGSSGSQTWHMYAHGANGGGWSTAIPVSLTVTAESASIWFNQVNGTNVTSGSVPTIGGSPNTYQYAIKNTSSVNSVSLVNITVPGLDINNVNAYDGTNTWNVNNIATGGVTLTFPAGQTDGTGGCTVNTSNSKNPTTAGANGLIQLNCTTFKPGDIIYVNFTAVNPSSQNDTYAFPATVDGNAAGNQWLDSDEVTEQFSLGLNIVVDPANPGPGASSPVVNCANPCTFAGSTVDFGNILNNTAFTFADVVRTSVVYTGSTSAGHTLDLYVSASQNPTNSTGSPTNELQTEVDSAHSTQGASISFLMPTYSVIPTTCCAAANHIAQMPETYRSTSYDIIDSYKVSIGAEPITGYTVNLTYTVIAN